LNILRKSLEFLATRNGIRLVAAVLAVVVWYAIRAATSNSLLVTDIPLAIQPPPEWTVVDASATTIDVAFLGTRDDLRYLNRDQIKASIDVRSRTNSQRYAVAIGPANVNAPGNARIEFIRPSRIDLRLDQEITKQVPIRVETQNILPEGYEIERLSVLPAAVLLSGPAGKLANVESVSTMPIDLDGRIRSINKRRIALVPVDHAAGISMEPTAATLDLIIAERFVIAQFADVSIYPLLPSGRRIRAEIDPEIATVTVKGRPEVVNTLSEDDLRLLVDATAVVGMRATSLPVRAFLPAGIALVRTDPATVSVQIQE
jgi:YbbR domain-containing protein